MDEEKDLKRPAFVPSEDGCCGRFRAELSHPAFSPMEAVSGQIIDAPATFGPKGLMTLLFKTVLVAWSLSIIIMGLIHELVFESTYWANSLLVLSTIYFGMSWYSSALGSIEQAKGISIFQNMQWALYAVVAPAQVVVTLGYWGMDLISGDSSVVALFTGGWNDTTDENETAYPILLCYYITVYGGTLILLLLEGQLINRTPLRIRHFGLLVIWLIVGLVWTIGRVVKLEITGQSSTIEDDENLYGVLKWDQDPVYALLMPFFFALAPPMSFLVVYWLSLPARRYSHCLKPEEKNAMMYVQMQI